MVELSITPSIAVTIGCHSRLYYAFVTSAPTRLDAPSTVTLYAATLLRRGRFAADDIALGCRRRHRRAHDSCSWMRPSSAGSGRATVKRGMSWRLPTRDSSARTHFNTGCGNGFEDRCPTTSKRRTDRDGQVQASDARNCRPCRSTTTPSGPLPLAQTARGGEGVLGRPCLRRIGDPLWLRTTVGADRRRTVSAGRPDTDGPRARRSRQMKPPFAAQLLTPALVQGRAGRQFSPVAFALDRLFPKHGRAPYSAAERLVVLVIVRATSADGNSGDFNCFLSYPTIARWAGVSIASVKRALQKHCDGPAPLCTGRWRVRRGAMPMPVIASRS